MESSETGVVQLWKTSRRKKEYLEIKFGILTIGTAKTNSKEVYIYFRKFPKFKEKRKIKF
jgi:hypothetical protein